MIYEYSCCQSRSPSHYYETRYMPFFWDDAQFFRSLGTLFLNQRRSFLLQPGVRRWTIAFLQLVKMYDERSRLQGTLKYAVDRFSQANYQIWSSIALLSLDRFRTVPSWIPIPDPFSYRETSSFTPYVIRCFPSFGIRTQVITC